MLEVWVPERLLVCVVVPKAEELGLHMVVVHNIRERGERPEEWVPVETASPEHNRGLGDGYSKTHHIGEDVDSDVVDIFSIHSSNGEDLAYQKVPGTDGVAESLNKVLQEEIDPENPNVFTLWKQQFLDAFTLESTESRKLNCRCLRVARISWQLLQAPRRIMFSFLPPYTIAHGWVAFISSLIFISVIAYIVTKLTDLISCITGINPYVIAFTALASGTSWPDLVASKIAAERQITADSAIAIITCSSVNIYVGIGVPWLIDTAYNFIVYRATANRECKGIRLLFTCVLLYFCGLYCRGGLSASHTRCRTGRA